tara:strand:+ start:254 stop:865 length:612 start_codon:yes stop_codon:yes gene_type:complete
MGKASNKRNNKKNNKKNNPKITHLKDNIFMRDEGENDIDYTELPFGVATNVAKEYYTSGDCPEYYECLHRLQTLNRLGRTGKIGEHYSSLSVMLAGDEWIRKFRMQWKQDADVCLVQDFLNPHNPTKGTDECCQFIYSSRFMNCDVFEDPRTGMQWEVFPHIEMPKYPVRKKKGFSHNPRLPKENKNRCPDDMMEMMKKAMNC